MYSPGWEPDWVGPLALHLQSQSPTNAVQDIHPRFWSLAQRVLTISSGAAAAAGPAPRTETGMWTEEADVAPAEVMEAAEGMTVALATPAAADGSSCDGTADGIADGIVDEEVSKWAESSLPGPPGPLSSFLLLAKSIPTNHKSVLLTLAQIQITTLQIEKRLMATI